MSRKILLFLLLGAFHSGCTDDCTQVRTYAVWMPYTLGYESIVKGISSSGPVEMEQPGKIYVYQQYLLIGEVKKGIHVIDNSDPRSPRPVSFIKIPGVLDFAVKDQVLYADSYMDLVALDLSNPLAVTEAGRKAKVFQSGTWQGRSWYYDARNQTVTDYVKEIRTETFKTNCGNEDPRFFGTMWDKSEYAVLNSSGPQGPTGSTGDAGGQGGSMARFTLYDNYLYSVSDSDLMVFDIRNPSRPDSTAKINLGWGIETIFPYEDKLFIGSNTGMYIYDNRNPEKPERMAIFNHARACDPVVVQGDLAYVTLRTGTCGTAPNQLQVINIENLYSPFLIRSYPMENPHGLSVLDQTLSVCEGDAGLKSFNVTEPNAIVQLQHLRAHHAYDVIQLSSRVLLVIGDDGFYQYDNSDPSNLQLLSKITTP